MFLAFQLSDIVTVPFGWLLGQLYNLTNNYGLAMIIFAITVQLVLLPITAKSKKGMMKMSRMQPKIQAIQRKYADDKQKQQEEIQKLQKEEGASMGCGGCLWTLVPMLILIPLFSVIRAPLEYILGADSGVISEIATAGGFDTSNHYWQVAAAQALFDNPEKFAGIAGISQQTLRGIDFSFLGINLGNEPVFAFWKWEVWNWANIGLFLIPLLSAASQVVQMLISQKMNNSVVTDEKGMQDKETAQNSQSAQQSKMMTWMFPLMSLFIGFTVPAGLSVYWFVGGVVRMVEDIFLTKHYRKVYDAEDAERLKRYMEQEALEAEKERIRAEKRAANPDGITENTSKKKLQQRQKAEEEAARAAAKREYDARKGIVEEAEPAEKQTLSGIADRPNCKGRAYNPHRYDSTEEKE